MSEPLEPFDADVRALLDRARPVAALDPARLDRLHARVIARLALPAAGGSGSGGGEASGGGGGTSDAGAGAAKAIGAGTAALVAGVFALGVIAGVALDRTFAPAVAPVVAIAASQSPETPPIPTDSEAPWTAVVPELVPSSAPLDPPRATASRAPDGEPSSRGLAAERALLDVARGALARGEPTEALAAVRRHGAEYPRGALVEEREALAVKALVAAGQLDAARIRAAEFERRFPNGLMLRVVRAAVSQ